MYKQCNNISIEGTLRIPLTCDDHTIHPSHLSDTALNELKRPKIDLSRPSMN